jgi:2-polyprenyl-6-methoxyphenol hydroxylase-like FAD-dependent oxidoreductase
MGDSEKVIVVGAGPVGSLAALYAANRGHVVEIYELRSGEFSQASFVTWPLSGVATKHVPK